MWRVGSIAVVAFIAGCSLGIDSSYPDEWEDRSRVSNECPNIDGRYSNVGFYSNDAAYHSYAIPEYATHLTYRLGGSPSQSYIVDLSHHDGVLTLNAMLNGEVKNTLELVESRGDFDCRSGVLWIRPKIDAGADGVGGFRNTNSLGLQMSEDGNLIGQDRTSGAAALMWAIPLLISQTHWYKWNKWDPRFDVEPGGHYIHRY